MSLFFCSLIILFNHHIITDTSVIVSKKINANFSGSFLSLSNWKGESMKSYTLFSGMDYYASNTKGVRQSVVTGKSELGYTNFIDSLWKKHSDNFNLQYLLKSNRKTISCSMNARLQSQFLNTYCYEQDILFNRIKRKWQGTFMNPSEFELGYGMNILFWEKSNLNLSLASARLRMNPLLNKKPEDTFVVIGKVKRGTLVFDFGVSGQLLVYKKVAKDVEVNSTGKVFIKGFDKDEIQFDFSNTMSYKFRKHIEMRADMKCVYDPLTSLKLQYRNEFLFGVVYKYVK